MELVLTVKITTNKMQMIIRNVVLNNVKKDKRLLQMLFVETVMIMRELKVLMARLVLPTSVMRDNNFLLMVSAQVVKIIKEHQKTERPVQLIHVL